MRLVVAAVAMGLLSASAQRASAQEPAPPEPAHATKATDARAEARELAEKGDSAFGAGRCDKAIGFWKKADAVFHAPTLLLRIARCEALLGHVVDATATLERIVGEPLPASAPPTWGDARIQAGAEIAGVRERIARIDVHVSTAPGQSPAIEIDDAPLAPGERGARVDPGSHRVVVRVGERTAERHLTLDDGEQRTVELSIVLETPRPKPRTQRDAGLVIGAVGLVALGVGAGFGISALSISSHLDGVCGTDHKNCAPSEQPSIDRVQAHALISDFALGGGAALALTGGLLILTDTSGKKAEPRVRLQLGRASLLELE
jgi:hypothetical protein